MDRDKIIKEINNKIKALVGDDISFKYTKKGLQLNICYDNKELREFIGHFKNVVKMLNEYGIDENKRLEWIIQDAKNRGMDLSAKFEIQYIEDKYYQFVNLVMVTVIYLLVQLKIRIVGLL